MLIIVWCVLSLPSAKTEYNTDKPILVKQSNNLTLLTGMTANFDCEFETDLPLLVHWLRPAEVIRNSMNDTEMDSSDPSHFETIKDLSLIHI